MRTNLVAADTDFAEVNAVEIIIRLADDIDENIQAKAKSTPIAGRNLGVLRVMKSTVDLLTRAAEIECFTTLKMDRMEDANDESQEKYIQGLASALARWVQSRVGAEKGLEQIAARLHWRVHKLRRQIAPRGSFFRQLLSFLCLNRESRS